ncbi:hypothetical protein AB1Y20_003225 [Prymnesium parvum]|uniref:Major facilitator superfamily (MFS) profile domain-containing protein n=1 Tax=Prymnesium parvum TaxID=97485 RepID=A0AB34JA77_PRYPA
MSCRLSRPAGRFPPHLCALLRPISLCRRALPAPPRSERLSSSPSPPADYSPWDDPRVVAVCASTAALMLGHGVASPLLPLLASELGASASSVGLALSAFGAARLLLNVPVGLAADRLHDGTRPLLVGGGLVTGLGTAACGVATDTSELLAARLVAGAGNACYLGAAQIHLSGELSTPATRARVLGANYSCLLLGVSAGPVLGGLLADCTGSLRAPWVCVAVLNLIAAAHAALQLPRRSGGGGAARQGRGAAPPAGSWKEIISTRFVVAGIAHASTFALRQGGRNLLLALVAVDIFNYSPRDLGFLFGAMALVDLAAVGSSSSRADAVKDRRLVIVPAVIGASAGCAWVGAVAALAQGGDWPVGSLHSFFLGGVAVWSLSTASLGPALPAYVADLCPSAQRGLATALFRSCGDVGFVVTPVALGYLSDASSTPIAMATLSVAAASTGCLFAAFGTPVTPHASASTRPR